MAPPQTEVAENRELDIQQQASATERVMAARAWALRPDALSAVSAVIRSHSLSAEQLLAPVEPEAARQQQQLPGAVAVVPLKGLLTATPSLLSLLFGGGGGLQGFRSAFREALDNQEVSSILIDVNSPGGSTDLIAETAAMVREARGQKQVVAVANTQAASGAYWIASQADELVVTPSGMVGSVGVFAVHEDWSKFNEMMGVAPTYISAGEFKVEGNPDEPLSEEARAAIQQMVDDFYGWFVGDVAKGRGTTPTAVASGFGQGRMETAKRAVTMGMADRVATFEDTAARLLGAPRRRSAQAGDDGPAPLADADESPPAESPEEPSPPEAAEGAQREGAEPAAADESADHKTDESHDEHRGLYGLDSPRGEPQLYGL